MKFRIEYNIDAVSLKNRVPTEYKDLAIACEAQLSDLCTLITFPHNRTDLVKSGLVEKALKKLNKKMPRSLVVVGGCFSLESVELLRARNALFLNLSEFVWNDEEPTAIKSGETR